MHGGGAENEDPAFGRDLGSERLERLPESALASKDQQPVRHSRQSLEERKRETQTRVRPH